MVSKTSNDPRLVALTVWAEPILNKQGIELATEFASVSDDASFRRYFRATHATGSLIGVDAPPDKEDNASFLKIQALLASGGLQVPQVIGASLEQGFLLLSDLGDELLLPRLQNGSVETQVALYRTAMECLQRIAAVPAEAIPGYTEAKLRDEMQLFPDWLVTQQLGLDSLISNWLGVTDLLVENAVAQPQVLVHRDFHARNLMIQPDGSFALIDFQDAVQGPVTYDLVSLLKDCYWCLPRANVVELVEEYRARQMPEVAAAQFLRWFDLMGFQRHLKCAGIFCRLNLRDGKAGYLQDIPLVLHYLIEVAAIYPELNQFGLWLESAIAPRMSEL